MAHLSVSICATSIPDAKRRRYGMLVAPERRVSSGVITKMAAPVFDGFRSFLETEVAWMFIRSSRLASDRSGSLVCCAKLEKALSAAISTRRRGYLPIRDTRVYFAIL